MWRLLIALIFVSAFAYGEDKAKETKPVPPAESNVPQLTEASTATAPLANTDEATAPEKEDPAISKNPGIKVVKSLLGYFTKMADNREKFLSGKEKYADYIAKDTELGKEASLNIDYYDVCEKSLKYDYDAKRKKFKKDHWAGKSQEERNTFASLFKQLVESIAYPLANEYFGDLKMKHKISEDHDKDELHIMTFIHGKKSKKRNREFVMDWYLHQKPTGGWIIYDISIEGERWVPGFRSQFNDVISKKNYAELLKLMRKKLGEETADRKKKDLQALDDRKKETAAKNAAKEPVAKETKEEKKDGTTDQN